MYQVRIKKSALKELQALPIKDVKKVSNKIDKLKTEPRPIGCKKLKGQEDLWRIRVGDFRIIYNIDEEVQILEIRKIGHRRDIYE